jgi:tRNA pseudouridine synthase 10
MLGYSGNDSVEHRIIEPILKVFDGSRVKITWIGSEDKNSLVLGSGRPFFAEILEPRLRRGQNLKNTIKNLNDGISVRKIQKINYGPKQERHFLVSVRSKLTLEKKIISKTATKLEDTLTGALIKIRSPNRKKSIQKKIYKFSVDSIEDKRALISLKCDGGLGIRKFFTGDEDSVIPNLSSILGRKISLDEEKPFDIIDIQYKI